MTSDPYTALVIIVAAPFAAMALVFLAVLASAWIKRGHK